MSIASAQSVNIIMSTDNVTMTEAKTQWSFPNHNNKREIGSNGSSTGGNNSPIDEGPKKKKKGNRQRLGKRFLVIWNNYPADSQKWIMDHLVTKCVRYQFQTEVGEECGTPHVQGYVEFKKRCRPTETFSKGEAWNLVFKTANGTAMENAVYTEKEGPGGWDGKWRMTLNMPRPLEKITYEELRDEQKEIVDQFKGFENAKFGRKIHWFWEHDGNWGKTTAVKYMVDQLGAIVTGGKATDVKFMVREYCLAHEGEGPPIVIWHLPRTQTEAKYISYNAIEAVKDGIFASPKFKGGMCRYNCPWVIIFANIPPEYDTLTEDRWVVEELK